MSEKFTVKAGGCDCGYIRYAIHIKPMFVHCCHCTWCQRESGAAFAINAIIESTAVRLSNHQPVLVDTPTASGGGQRIARCPKCQVAVWSHYSGFNQSISFVKVGTLDEASSVPPDIHIFTQSKQTWFELPKNVPVFERYYNKQEMWPADSLKRLNDLINSSQ